jgi:predicted nucleic acid-binding protein
MSGRKLVLDSNIVIYIAQKQLDPQLFLLPEDQLFVSDITIMETLGYAFTDQFEKQEIESLLSVLIRIPIENIVVQNVVAIKQHHKIKLPDAIIAATALVYDCILVTRDSDDFAGLPGLVVINPFEG